MFKLTSQYTFIPFYGKQLISVLVFPPKMSFYCFAMEGPVVGSTELQRLHRLKIRVEPRTNPFPSSALTSNSTMVFLSVSMSKISCISPWSCGWSLDLTSGSLPSLATSQNMNTQRNSGVNPTAANICIFLIRGACDVFPRWTRILTFVSFVYFACCKVFELLSYICRLYIQIWLSFYSLILINECYYKYIFILIQF